MHAKRLLLSLLFAILVAPQTALAKQKLITLSDGVVVYSGPGTSFRKLTVLKDKTEITGSNSTIKNKNGEFYRVVVTLSRKKKAIGFIPVSRDIAPLGEADAEELEKFGEIALLSHGLQFSYSKYRDRFSQWDFGYINYISSGFYVKGFGGQIHGPTEAGGIFGLEMGNDALLIGPISGLVSLATGMALPEEEGTFFEGSTKLNAVAMANIGARYNFGGRTSLSIAASQLAIFNQNNSFVTSGATITFEVGL